ncbi:MAG: SusC/RagA family TonB-linked outer membrane protein, partial [Muribaculaceae bacterium]|nr:SusC/RagA family TonB-linked outer membrane protein [Muribaculaceae bacterium]
MSPISAATEETAPERVLTGVVTDHHGETLPGVVVKIKSSPYGTMTDADGFYLLRGRFKRGAKIQFSCVGMKPVEFTYEGQEQQDAAMESDDNMLKEVVVSAESNINAIDIRSRSGVVQTVDMKRLNEKPMVDLGLALQGSVPGLIVTNSGELGSKPKIRIRGNQSLRTGDAANEPLYVLDGKVISSDAFNTLNPQDIREIKVLKDAAACALYGIKAANGVIEISSQRGTRSGGIDVTYSLNMGVTFKGRRGIHTMDSAEKLEFERLMGNPAAPGYRYSADYYNRYERNNPRLQQLIAEGAATLDSLRAINTDWFDELMRLALYQSHNISVRGGNEKTSYFLSGNFSSQGGQVKGNNTLRGNLRLGIDQQLGSIGYFSFNMDGGYTETKSPNGSDFSPSSLVYNLNPYETPSGGKLWSYPNRTFNDLQKQFESNSNDKRGGASASINLRPFEGGEISAVAGLDYMVSEVVHFTPASSYSEQQSGFPAAELGRLSKSMNTVLNFSYNIRALYNKLFNDKHDLTLSLNHDYYLTDTDNLGITGYGVGNHASAALINQSITGSRKPAVASLKEKVVQLGVGAVAGYTFEHTYDLFATYKLDASSVLPSSKRWNSAWAAGLGWTPTQYNFLNGNPVLSRLNFKGSYGQTASLAGVSAAQTIGTFAYLEDTYGTQRLLQLLALYNTDLKPEHTTSIDAGVQLGLFRSVNIDFG